MKGLSGTSRVGIFVLAGSFLVGFIEFLMHLKDARELMTSAIALGLKIEPEPKTLEIEGWLFFAISLGIFVSLAFFLLWIKAEFRERDEITVRTLRGMMRAAANVRSKLLPPGYVADLTIEKVAFVYQINKDFTTQVRRTYQIRAGANPIYFIERGFRVRDYADASMSLIDIDFQVRDPNDPNGVVYFPMVNERKEKSACIFFLPRIEPAQGRTFEMSYKWPGMTRALKVEGEEEFTLRHPSAGDLLDFSMEIYLEPGSGGTLSWEESGPTLPSRKLDPVQSQLGWPGVKYTGANIPPAMTNAGIRLRLRWKAN